MSKTRWSTWQAIGKRLVAATGMTWNGLAAQDLAELVEFVPWPEPLEGCLLHALVQATHKQGRCVVEIGSRRGRSLSILAMALRGVDSESLLFSIDPHEEQPCTLEHCRLALRQIGEEARLVQVQATSDRAAAVLGRGVASLIFIDGDHSYDQVIADFDNYRDILAPGGCLVFHDYGYGNHNGVPEADPDVRRAIDEHVMPAKGFRPLLLAHTQFAVLKQ
ncbi:MAG: class I SAM-dependent methyltransferase [Planctomycetes bacterium]|nr:class I SAM-dependent methyltransferase [Planctomycetota bacterium]